MPWIREQTSMDFAWRWLGVGLAGLLVLTGSARGDDSGPRPLDIYFIDVMGGAATLIVTPEKESILIDSGWPGFSNNPVLVRTIQPTVAIMHNGPRKGGAPATVKLLRSIPSIKAAYQLHRNAQTSSEDNTDPGLIANLDPAGGQFIHVSVTPGGSKFNVQIGPDGPQREIASR